VGDSLYASACAGMGAQTLQIPIADEFSTVRREGNEKEDE
jgi:hypothetical protein